MLKTLFGLVSGGSGITGAIIGGLVALLVIGGGIEEFRISLWRTDVAKAEAETAKAQVETAKVTANRDELAAAIKAQNTAIDKLIDDKKLITADANTRVSDALRAAEAKRRAAENIPGSGPEVMNRWLVDTLVGRP